MSMVGKVALVTGAGRGHGKGIALAFGRAGAHVAVNDIVAETAEQTAREIGEAGGSAGAVPADVADPEQVTRMVDAVVGRFGRLDILVNNAAVLIWGDLPSLPLETWERTLAVNLTGPFLCAQAAARVMIQQGQGGRIINIGSIVGSQITRTKNAPYNATKAGLTALTRSIALDLAGHAITANLVSPGSSGGAMAAEHFTDRLTREQAEQRLLRGDPEDWRLGVPLGKLARPEDIAHAVLFLADDASHHITGVELYVDGGQAMF